MYRVLRTVFIVFLVLLFLVALTASRVQAQAVQSTPDLSTLVGLVAFFGTPAFLGFFKSQFLEQSGWFQQLSSQNKSLVVLLASVITAALSQVLLTLIPAPTFSAIQPFYAILFQALDAWTAGQIFHAVTKEKPPVPFIAGASLLAKKE